MKENKKVERLAKFITSIEKLYGEDPPTFHILWKIKKYKLNVKRMRKHRNCKDWLNFYGVQYSDLPDEIFYHDAIRIYKFDQRKL